MKRLNLIALLCFVIFCVMFSAKLGGVISISWFGVLSPIWAPLAAFFVYALMQFIGYGSNDPKF